jgi:hypothetical protein
MTNPSISQAASTALLDRRLPTKIASIPSPLKLRTAPFLWRTMRTAPAKYAFIIFAAVCNRKALVMFEDWRTSMNRVVAVSFAAWLPVLMCSGSGTPRGSQVT